MTDQRRYTEANRATWNIWAQRDTQSDHHADVARFRATGSSLRPIERDALAGRVAGTRLLHLQCNLGSDTLSWARLGAQVTGVDISDEAIRQACALAEEAGLAGQARFIRADLYDLPQTLTERFDIVVASYGVLCWAPDLDGWASAAAGCVAPGGELLLVDMHPMGGVAQADADAPHGLRLAPTLAYFHAAAPEDEGTLPGESIFTWRYSLGEVISAVAATGLRIEWLREYPFSFWRQFPQLTPDDDGYWRWPDVTAELPLLFALRATHPRA